MWWIIIVIAAGLIIYNINKDHKEHVKTHVSSFGGMMEKYNVLIAYLKSGGLSVSITKSSVILSSQSMTWTLDYVGYNLEVHMNGFIPMLGKISHKWIFHDEYPQDKMIEEIENYTDWQIGQLRNVADNNSYNHLNKH